MRGGRNKNNQMLKRHVSYLTNPKGTNGWDQQNGAQKHSFNVKGFSRQFYKLAKILSD